MNLLNKGDIITYDKDKVILNKKLPYEYKICLYILEEISDKGVIDILKR